MPPKVEINARLGWNVASSATTSLKRSERVVCSIPTQELSREDGQKFESSLPANKVEIMEFHAVSPV